MFSGLALQPINMSSVCVCVCVGRCCGRLLLLAAVVVDALFLWIHCCEFCAGNWSLWGDQQSKSCCFSTSAQLIIESSTIYWYFILPCFHQGFKFFLYAVMFNYVVTLQTCGIKTFKDKTSIFSHLSQFCDHCEWLFIIFIVWSFFNRKKQKLVGWGLLQ